jgi:diguanylate cyclase (GGDEF)-like protein/PAS domain S-box-containing protein
MTDPLGSLVVLPFALAAPMVIAAGSLILWREHPARVGWLHFFLSGAIGGWQLAAIPELLAATPRAGAAWAQLHTLFALFIPALQFHFAFVITSQPRHFRWAVVAAWAAACALAVCLAFGLFFREIARYPWGVYPVYSPIGWAFVAYTVTAIGACMRMYWRQHRDNPAGSLASRRGLMLLAALSVGALGAWDFLPTLGVDVFPAGGLAVAAGNLLNAYTTWRYRLVEVTPASAADLVMESMSDGVLVIDRDGLVRLTNPAACEILGLPREELTNRRPPATLCGPVLGWERLPHFPERDSAHAEREYVAPDGARRALDVRITLMREKRRAPQIAVIALRDVTAAVAARQQIHRLAYYDSLTHLPNRALLKERFAEAIARARRAGGMAAVLFMDLDRFKQVNDSLGHDAGDLLLKGVAERLGACVRETDWLVRNADYDGGNTLARLGGDEFVLLLSPLERPEHAARVGNRILEALCRPFQLRNDAQVVTGASIGLAIYPADGEDADTLMKRADLAMYQAKESGRNGLRFFDDEMNAAMLASTDLEKRMRRGLAHNEFALYYQPMVQPRGGHIDGVEAQIWVRQPQHGMVPAADFISSVEDPALLAPLSEWAIRTACDQLASWRAQDLPALSLALALPPGAAEKHDVAKAVYEALAQSSIHGASLILSLRAPVGWRASARTRNAVETLRGMGVRLVAEDFGGVQAPLASLVRSPYSLVRLPAAFLTSVGRGPDGGPGMRTLIQLAHTLELSVLVTGVDDAALAARLRDAGCDLMQGAAFGEPMPAHEVVKLLSHSAQRAAV